MRDDDPHRIRSLVIVGGGTAGWMAAAALAKHFQRTDLAITLVESSAIGTIGVGEATIPTIRRFYARLGMSDMEVMRATHATAKLGISFENWDHPGSRCLHPFGLFGQDYGGIGFHHLWLDARARGDETPLTAYSLGAGLADQGRMALPQPNPPTPLATYDWALHLDASLTRGSSTSTWPRTGGSRRSGSTRDAGSRAISSSIAPASGRCCSARRWGSTMSIGGNGCRATARSRSRPKTTPPRRCRRIRG